MAGHATWSDDAAWTPEDDAHLLQQVTLHGICSINKIARFMFRTAKSCLARKDALNEPARRAALAVARALADSTQAMKRVNKPSPPPAAEAVAPPGVLRSVIDVIVAAGQARDAAAGFVEQRWDLPRPTLPIVKGAVGALAVAPSDGPLHAPVTAVAALRARGAAALPILPGLPHPTLLTAEDAVAAAPEPEAAAAGPAVLPPPAAAYATHPRIPALVRRRAANASVGLRDAAAITVSTAAVKRRPSRSRSPGTSGGGR